MGRRKPHPAGRPPKKTVDAEGEQEQGTVFFYMPKEKPYGIFCQWHTSPFSIPIASLQWLVDMALSPPPPPTQSCSSSKPPKIEPDPSPPAPSTILFTHATTSSNPSISFNCAEQSYMFCKALYFSDATTARLILSTSDPKTQKKHGQNVKSFNFHQWGKVKSRVARVGNWYKYTEGYGNGKGGGNRHMRNLLLETQGRELAEAGRRDRIWGIGYKADEADLYREFWGENLLGKCLMDVRDRIIKFDGRALEETVDWEWDGSLEEQEVDERPVSAQVPEG